METALDLRLFQVFLKKTELKSLLFTLLLLMLISSFWSGLLVEASVCMIKTIQNLSRIEMKTWGLLLKLTGTCLDDVAFTQLIKTILLVFGT